ncbi:hypothetical protein RHODO2019_12040 [Rhodococcus antarcticus]|uniref:HNH endonuclease n=1 Tax=Rhodococcus antarcticus TaxID=2987751 RepID=A0ABY6NWZ5_9NOCA|nr:hypothetical protein [Rhodococcus antarcticus]UZJ23917.1 hypothetical protein RHODO2019_12040 [Rhodococcus antarcticus]
MDEASCDRCGAELPTEPGRRLAWSHHVQAGRPGWTCPACTREHSRSIEARLDGQWW